MDIPKGAATEAITIGGQSGLMIPQPHDKLQGQPLTKEQAHVLDQVLAENARNNLREQIKKLKGDKAAGQKLLDTYLAQYDFGKRAGGGFRAADPIEAESMDYVRKALTKALQAKGVPKKDIKASDVTAKAKQILAGPKGEAIRKRSIRIVRERDAEAEALVGSL